MRLDVTPALSDIIQAIELLDTPAAIDAADRIGDGAAQVLEFWELAPEWEPGTATVLHLRQEGDGRADAAPAVLGDRPAGVLHAASNSPKHAVRYHIRLAILGR